MKSEITWNGVAKSYRVGTPVVEFKKGRTRKDITNPELIAYCQRTKGFTVMVIDEPAPAPAPKQAAEATEPAADEPAAEEKPSTDEEPSKAPARTGGPRRGRRG